MEVFGYADDLSLLCPSFTGIKEMLNICEKYARKYDILFNATKLDDYGRHHIHVELIIVLFI